MRKVFTFLFLLALPSAASAQGVCTPFVLCNLGGVRFLCPSNPCTVAPPIFPGAVCNAPWAPAVAVAVCVAPGAACCNCINPGRLNCNSTLVDSNTVDVFVQSDRGLQSIQPNLTNASASIVGFQPGTDDTVVVIATKINTASRARVELRVCDTLECLICDPVISLVVRETGKPMRETIAQLPQEEGQVTIYNSSPGLKALKVTANGETFTLAGLKDGEERTLDVSGAMLPGEENIITLTGTGKPGGSATVMIHD